jgi:hypothetical protein
VKRFLLGTFACLVIGLGFVMLAGRWPALFWLVVVSIGLYLLFARKADVEFRIGVGGAEERRVYGGLAWKHQTSGTETAAAQRSDGLEVGSKWRDW